MLLAPSGQAAKLKSPSATPLASVRAWLGATDDQSGMRKALAAWKARSRDASLEGSWAAILSAKPSMWEACARRMSDSQSESVKAGRSPT